MKYVVILLMLAIAALIVVSTYSDSKACKGKGSTMLQGANGPLCARIEAVRT